MRSRIEEEIRPVEETIPPKTGKEKGRRRKKTSVEQEIVAEKENNFNFDELSGIKIQVFECLPIVVKEVRDSFPKIALF